ncbi:MAG: O-antigen ligase family protein [Thermoanaerobaculia bacterium]|nr:O-antigen ligase family protein [Thermoanaerobaculia bacterium]
MRAIISHPLTRAAGLLALLAWAPLPFGSVTPDSSLALVAGGLLVAAVALVSERRTAIARPARQVALALAAVAAFGVAQSWSWPAGLVGRLSPTHLEQSAQTHQILALDPPARAPLSFAPATSRRTALVWLLAAAGLVAGALLGRSRRVRRAILAVLAGGALFQVLFGFQQWRLRSSTIWGLEVPNQAVRLRGSFVNPNHLATFLLIVLPIAFAAVWWLLRHLRASRHPERWTVKLGPAALVWIALFAGLAFTGSRAGMLAGGAGIVLQLALIARAGEQKRIFWGGLGVVGLAVAYVAFSSFEAGFGRLTRLTEQGGFRLEGMADTWKLFTRFPWTGVGLGAFRAAFPLVHPVGEEGTWWHAHNDWLELAATTGLVGLGLVGYGVWWLGRGLARSWRRGARGEDRAAALAAIGACVAVGLQELLEFGLTLPANSFTLAAICGAALAVPLADPAAAKDEGAVDRLTAPSASTVLPSG